MPSVKWLLVGAGDISRKRVAPALASASGSELVGVCDVNQDLARSLADEHAAGEVFGQLDDALEQTSADAVYIATPVWLHVDQTIQALNAGKHVLVEKPLGINAGDCAKAVAAAGANRRKSGCSYYRRLYPRYQHAKKMLDDGEFGKIVSVRMNYASWFNPASDDPKYWRVLKSKSGGGSISDMGTHMFDVLIGLFGMPVSVYADCDNIVHQWDVEDSAAVVARLSNGAQVTAAFNWNSKTWRHEFEIVGTEARINWLPYDSGPVVKTVGRDIENLDLPSAENVHLPLVEDFVDAILTDRTPACSLAEAAKTNVLIDAIYRSSAEKREIVL